MLVGLTITFIFTFLAFCFLDYAIAVASGKLHEMANALTAWQVREDERPRASKTAEQRRREMLQDQVMRECGGWVKLFDLPVPGLRD